MFVRSQDSLSWFAAAINHPLAIQVFGVLFAFLVTARVGRALLRWWEGMMAVVNMQDGWQDACMFIMSYVKKELLQLHAQLNRTDLDEGVRQWVEKRISKLTHFGHKIIHWFSLMNAIGLGTLKSGEQRAFSEICCKYKDFKWIYSEDKEADKLRMLHGEERSSNQMEYLGELSIEEENQLAEVEEKTLLVVNWLYEALAIADGDQFMKVPPPILAQANSKIAAGMYSYLLAYRIAAVPYPFPLAQISAFLMIVFLMLMPVVVEKFTEAKMLTPILAFLIGLGYWGLNRVAIEIENPFGDDPNDLPLKALSDTFIDHLMESMTNCLRNIGKKANTVHDYSDSAMGIVTSKPPPALEKKDWVNPTKTANGSSGTSAANGTANGSTSPVPAAKGDSNTTPRARPRARSADPRARTKLPGQESPQNYKQQLQELQAPQNYKQQMMASNVPANTHMALQPGQVPVPYGAEQPYGFPTVPYTNIPPWLPQHQQQQFFGLMPSQHTLYQPFSNPSSSAMSFAGYQGYDGEDVDPAEIS
jgi:hypothetical protein